MNTFGRISTNVTMGSKYEFKPDKNPGIGVYEVGKAKDKISYRTDMNGKIR